VYNFGGEIIFSPDLIRKQKRRGINMHTLVIADDEINQLEGLRDMVDWESMGFAVSAVFTDGAELINYLANNLTDAVLTDIQMNCISGLDVAEHLHKNRLDTSVILISGYKEFEYAKKAMELGVIKYLVKPVSMDELNDTFVTLGRELDIKKAQSAEEASPLLWTQFFCEMIFGELNALDNELIKNMRLPILIENPAALLVFEIDGYQEFLQGRWHYEQDRFYVALQNIVNRQSTNVGFSYLVFRQEHRLMVFLSAEDLPAVINDYAEGVMSQFMDIFLLKTSYKVAIVADNLPSLARLCQTSKALDHFDFTTEQQKFRQSSSMEKADAIHLHSEIISKARLFIDANYMNNISLNDVADHVFLSPVYFSRFFKQQTGENFIDYLTNLRVTKAIDFLAQGRRKIYEIGKLVGYSSTKYFTRVFKSVTGYSPKDYQRKVIAGG